MARLACWSVGTLLVVCFGCSENSPAPPEDPPVKAAPGESTKKNSSVVSHGAEKTEIGEQSTGAEAKTDPPGLVNLPEKTASKPLPVFRPSDTRPVHDDGQLAEIGIHRYESKRLILYTDIDPQIAKTLPPIIDQAYEAWVEYFGELPPNRERTEYQLTGYIMKDRSLYRDADLLPDDLPEFFHGRHRGAQFWMNEQEWDYYRRHLMIHEGTHCFMTTMPTTAAVWYLEGMAELFGTHRIDENNVVQFRVMPEEKENFEGFGRIEVIEQDIRKAGYLTLGEVTTYKSGDYFLVEPYAWSWALCHFLDSHPKYGPAFHRLAKSYEAEGFGQALKENLDNLLIDLWTEWPLFAANLDYGYDTQRAAIQFEKGEPLITDAPKKVQVAANRGWQASGVLIEEGKTYQVSASGQFILADDPKPWISEPQGISFLYDDGRPLGLLVASIRSEPPTGDTGVEPMLLTIEIGREQSFVAPITGTLYLRLNDFWSQLADNSGHADVEVRVKNTALSPP